MDKSAIENVVASAKSRLEIWARLIDLAQIKKMAEVGGRASSPGTFWQLANRSKRTS